MISVRRFHETAPFPSREAERRVRVVSTARQWNFLSTPVLTSRTHRQMQSALRFDGATVEPNIPDCDIPGNSAFECRFARGNGAGNRKILGLTWRHGT